jgi:hypothetical protein
MLTTIRQQERSIMSLAYNHEQIAYIIATQQNRPGGGGDGMDCGWYTYRHRAVDHDHQSGRVVPLKSRLIIKTRSACLKNRTGFFRVFQGSAQKPAASVNQFYASRQQSAA